MAAIPSRGGKQGRTARPNCHIQGSPEEIIKELKIPGQRAVAQKPDRGKELCQMSSRYSNVQ